MRAPKSFEEGMDRLNAILAQMQQEESDIPNAIKRLQSNEAYLETIRRDMKYLEREKGEWQLYQEILSHDRVKMQKLI